MGLPKTTHPGACPAIALSGRFAGAIQDGSDRQIRHLAGQYANKIKGIAFHRPAGLADLVLLHDEARMIAALPMDDEGQCVVHYIDDDLLDQ